MDKTNKDKPVKEREIKELIIEQEGQKGDGIAKINNYIIIIKNAKIGCKYKIIITATYATYAFGRIIEEIKGKTATEIMQEVDKEE